MPASLFWAYDISLALSALLEETINPIITCLCAYGSAGDIDDDEACYLTILHQA